MTTYKEIVGQKIRKISSNPSEAQTGQMWYNTTVSGLKALAISEAWASGGPMITARTGLASAGTQTANVFIGGQMSNSPNAPLNTVELYNGTGWSSNPNNAPYSASNNCGTGTQTAALSWGGYPNVSTTLEFDGSAFSTGGSLSTGRELTSNNIGIQTAAIAASGFQRPGTYPTQTEEYNGSSWTGGPVVNTPRYSAAGAGTTTAALISGGIEPGQLTATEEYDGSSWTTVTSRPYAGGNSGTSGTQTASLAYGGNPGGAVTTTVAYDGTSWSTKPAMSQSRAMMGSSAGGSSSAALASSGAAPTATEEFTSSTNVITAGAWSSGGTLSRSPTTHSGVGLGSTPAGVYIGGVSSPGAITADTELYNGSAWTSGTSTPLNIGYGGGGGTSAAAIVLSGEDPPGSGTTTLEGDASSSWTAGGTRNNAAQGFTYAGTQTSFVTVGGAFPPSYSDTNKVEMYDGTSWTNSPGTYPASTSHGGASGTSTAAIFYGGTPGTQATAYTWNGSSWTSASNMIEARKNMAFNENAPSSQAYSIGGTLSPPAGHSNVTKYNGTTWATAPSLGTAADKSASGGDESTGIFKCAGEYGPGPIGNQTEEFNVEVLTSNVKGFSSS